MASTSSTLSVPLNESIPSAAASPRLASGMLPPSTAASSASGSKSNSAIGTPRLLSRRSSAREKPLARASSLKEKGSTPENEVIETPQLRLERDPETGRKMINQYLVLHEIGHGTHGRVRLGRDMTVEEGLGYHWAIKIVDRNPKKKRLAGLSRQRGRQSDGAKMMNENEIRKEIAIFKKVNHPNVVRMKEIIDDPESSKLFMILEYCEGGEVHWKEDDGTPALTVAETRQIFRDTLLGLEYLHHQGIIHRDIKPSNLLYSGGLVKISDFGCSHYSEALRTASAEGDESYVDDVELAKTAGSPAFFAPEMCSGESTGGTITNAIDVWALGVTLYCLLFAKTPFDAANEYLLMQLIPVADYEVPPIMGKDRLTASSPEAREALDLLKNLLEKDPSKRISLEQAKRHPFTLRGLSDPSAWLISTDPHAQSFVTVSNDEVAAVVINSSSFSQKLRKGMKTISHKLFAGGRSRSHSISDSTRGVTLDPGPGTPVGRRLASDSGASSSVQLASPQLSSTGLSVDRVNSGFAVHRPTAPASPMPTPPRLSSTSSLDKLNVKPDSNIKRRNSTDLLTAADLLNRPRSTSNASSHAGFGLGTTLVRLLSRNSSQQSRFGRRTVAGSSDSSHAPELPHAPEILRGQSFDEATRRQSLETFESSSSAVPSPERTWDSRSRPPRRGSNLSEDITPARVAEEDGVDWDGDLGDLSGDEDCDLGPTLPSAPADWHLSSGLGLDVTTPPHDSPGPGTSPTHSLYRPVSRVSSGSSPYRSHFHERTRSPLGLRDDQASVIPEVDGDDDEDDGIILGGKRGRKGSLLGRAPVTQA